jgi:hypothetical protein
MARTVIRYADEGVAVGEHANVLITAFHQPPTMPRLQELRKHIVRAAKEWPNATCGFSVIAETGLTTDVPRDVLDASKALTRDFPPVGSAIVVEAAGFTGSAIRAFLTGMFLVARNHGKIHGTVEQGAAYLAPVASTAGGVTVTTADLVAAVTATRAAIKASP